MEQYVKIESVVTIGIDGMTPQEKVALVKSEGIMESSNLDRYAMTVYHADRMRDILELDRLVTIMDKADARFLMVDLTELEGV